MTLWIPRMSGPCVHKRRDCMRSGANRAISPCRRTAGRGGRAPANVATCPDKTYTHDGWLGWEHCLYHAILDAAPAPAPKRARVHEEGCFE